MSSATWLIMILKFYCGIIVKISIYNLFPYFTIQVCTKSMDSPYIGLQFTFKQISQDTINHFKK